MTMNVSSNKVEKLRHLPAFEHLSPGELERLAEVVVRRVYAPGQLIFLEGDSAPGLWFVVEGRVRIVKESVNGRIQGLCVLNRGKCFGGCPLFDGETNPANAQALDGVTLLLLPRDDLQLLIHRDYRLAMTIMRLFNQRLSQLASLSEKLATWGVAYRINDNLLAYADESQPYPVVTLTHEKLAELSGTVREVVTRHLSQLEERGAIQTQPGQIALLDMVSLATHCLGAAPR